MECGGWPIVWAFRHYHGRLDGVGMLAVSRALMVLLGLDRLSA